MSMTLLKDTLRLVARNKLRYVSIVVIVALGISFYVGIKSASPQMSSTANAYFNEHNLLDVYVTSRIPFSDDDINRISELKNVDKIVRKRYIDALARVGNVSVVDRNGMELSLRVTEFSAEAAKKYSQTGEADDSYMDRLILVDGRYPEREGECVIDSRAVRLYNDIGIGTEITLNGDGASVTDTLKSDKLTVVGTVDSPIYISSERGSSQVGSGSLSAFAYADSRSFSTEDYNELLIKIPDSENYDKFSVQYDSIVTELADEINLMSSDIIASKLASIKSEYNGKIADKEKEIADYDASSKSLLENKQKEINDFKKYVNSEDEILSKEKSESEKKKKSTKSALDSEKKKYEKLKTDYDANVRKYDGSSQKIDGFMELKKLYDDLNVKHTSDKKNLDSLESDKNDKRAEMESARSSYNKADSAVKSCENKISSLTGEISQLKSDISALEAQKKTSEDNVKSVENQISDTQKQIDAYEAKIADETITAAERLTLSRLRTRLSELKNRDLPNAKKAVEEKTAQISSKKSSQSSKEETLKKSNSELPSLKNVRTTAYNALTVAQTSFEGSVSNYETVKKSYDADTATLGKYKKSMNQLTAGQTELTELQKKIESQKKELESRNVSLTVAQLNYSLAVRNSDVKIKKAQADLNEAKNRYYTIDNEYTTLKNEVDQKKGNLNGDLKTLKNTLKNVESITWNAVSQTNLSGHKSFISSMENINSMSMIFPLIFLFTAMVAGFVIMMKNVEDERNSIGLFKAFGYSNYIIIAKYLLYSTAAWFFGAVIGIVLGTCLLPGVIYSIFGSAYSIPDINIAFNIRYIIRGSLASLATTTAASCIAVIRELRFYPAVLMRPKMISYNRRSLIEYSPSFWGRMSYGMILLVRTISRSRKRVVVGTVAIACCTALILSALGLLNSASDVKKAQYSKNGVFRYDIQMVLNAEQEPGDSLTSDKLEKDKRVKSSMLISNIAYDVSATQSRWKGFDVAHVVVPADVDSLKNYVHFKIVVGTSDIRNGGAVISEKMADDLKMKVGSTVYFTDSDSEVHTAKIVGITENYIDHYVYMSPQTYEDTFGRVPSYKYILCLLKDYLTPNEIAVFSGDYLKTEEVTGATETEKLSDSVDISINQVLALVILFVAAACILAAIVMYTIANVNISERTHEIANIKVIGFSDSEVLLYVTRENIVSTAVGAIIGLIGGIFLHKALVAYISVGNIMFGSHVFWWSFIVSGLLIVAVALLAAIPILIKINRINMPETLKSIE